MTSSDILSLRKDAVRQYPLLLSDSYEPSAAVFGQIQDRRPWWGIGGQCVYGPGYLSILGPSEESRFILNPYLLVGIAAATNRIWNPAKITQNELVDPDFPFYWEPRLLRFDAANAFEIVDYDVSRYYKAINATGKLLSKTYITLFSLVAYNARDFGFSYLYADLDKSINISNVAPDATPVAIRQFLHSGGSCGYPGGCNNVSPEIFEIDRISFTRLPARLVVDLFKVKPQSVRQKPDFLVILDLH